MKTFKKLIVDPPSGWKYGFPKECTWDTWRDVEKFKAWLLENGYPEADIKLACSYSRAWEEDCGTVA